MVTVKNPILMGFYPDPSICRKGEDYYIVNSSFVYAPGVPIFHSRDLAHWEQIGNILDRPSQLPVAGADISDGIYAPTIRYHDGLFYMITTNVTHGNNFIVTAENPEGPWSEPYYLGDDAPGIDPSLFFDDDGKCYYCGTRPNPEGVRYNGDWEIWIQELDLKTMKLVGESMAIWKGAVKGCIWPEGPHIYKIDGYYYLLHAEGGTGPEHSITVARSKKLFQWFEGCPRNPIFTHRNLGMDYPVIYAGHGDLVDDGKGNWYVVMLASRPCKKHSSMGRETFLARVIWENGWPVIAPGVGHLEDEFTIDMPEHRFAEEITNSDVIHFWGEQLDQRLVAIEDWTSGIYSLTEREGALRIRYVLEKKITPVIILDEANYLSNTILNDLKMIFNFEMDSRERAVVLLVGLPQLNNILRLSAHEPLRQRLVMNYHMEGLSIEESKDYIRIKLKQAGCHEEVFDENALQAISNGASGIPRMIDNLCSRCLLIAEKREQYHFWYLTQSLPIKV